MDGGFCSAFGPMWTVMETMGSSLDATKYPGGWGGILMSAWGNRPTAQMRVRPTDLPVAGGWRSQLAGAPLPSFGHLTLEFDWFFEKAPTMNEWAIASLHSREDAGEVRAGGPLTFALKDGIFRCATRAVTQDKIDTKISGEIVVGQLAVDPTRTCNVRVDMRLTNSKGGYIEFSVNGKQIGSFDGPTSYNDDIPPYPKLGPYYWEKPGEVVTMYSHGMRIT